MFKATVGVPDSTDMVEASIQSGPSMPDFGDAPTVTLQQSNPSNIQSIESVLSSILTNTNDDNTDSRLKEFLTSFAVYLSKSGSNKTVPVNKPVVNTESMLTMSDIVQPTTVKMTEKNKEKIIKIKTQKKSVKACLSDAAYAFPPYPRFDR